MFGRQKKHQEETIRIDATLESDVAGVEESVAAYLSAPTDATRGALLAALETLDAQTDRSDAYEGSVIGSGAVGYASKGEVFGETSIDSVVDEVSSAELNAQVALVQAAKNEVRSPSPATLAALQSAQADLAAKREQGPGGR